jgi:hypothetical protein
VQRMKHFFAVYLLGVCGSVKGPVQSMVLLRVQWIYGSVKGQVQTMVLPVIDFFDWNVFKNKLCAKNPVKLLLG